MLASEFIKRAQSVGWRVVSSRQGVLELACRCYGCKSTLTLSLDALGAPPERCKLDHHGQYSQSAYDGYKALVEALKRKRRALGLSQEDLCAAAGLADGHINKLEAFARTAQLPTLQLWAQTLGLEMTLIQTTLPAATARAMERRATPLREVKMHHQRTGHADAHVTHAN